MRGSIHANRSIIAASHKKIHCDWKNEEKCERGKSSSRIIARRTRRNTREQIKKKGMKENKNVRDGRIARKKGIKRTHKQGKRQRYSRMVLLLDEIEFLFDPLASVRHREFQPASSPAATAATLQEKGERKRTDSIRYVYTHDNGDATENTRTHTWALKPYAFATNKPHPPTSSLAVTLWHCV